MQTGEQASSARSRRQQILDAGLESFLQRGVGGTTVDHIRERSGASVGSFYHHFTSTVEVAAAVYLEILEGYQQSFVRALQAHRRASRGIEGAVRHHLRWVGRHPKAASYLMHCREPEVVATSEARTQELNRSFFGAVQVWLQRHAENGDIRVLPANLYYALWMGPAESFARLWLASGQSPARLAEARAVLPSAAWEALRVAGRGARTPPTARRRRSRGL